MADKDFINQPIYVRDRRRNTLLTHISSKNKSLASCPNNSFSIDLDSSELNDIVGIIVNRVFIPNVINNITDTCNDVQIELSDTTLVNIPIPNGFYDIISLADFIETSFNAIIAPEVLSYTFNSNTSIIRWSLTGPRTFRFNIAPDSGTKDIARDKMKMNTGDAFSAQKIGIDKVDLYPRTQSLFLELNFAKSNYVLPQFNERSILIDIPVLGPHGSIISYKDSGDKENIIDLLQPTSMDTLIIRVLDDNLLPVTEIVNFDWHMTLVLLK